MHTYQAACGVCQLLGECEDPSHSHPWPPPLWPGFLLQRQVFIRVFWAGSLTKEEKTWPVSWFTSLGSKKQAPEWPASVGQSIPEVTGWIHTDCMVLEHLLSESKNGEEGTGHSDGLSQDRADLGGYHQGLQNKLEAGSCHDAAMAASRLSWWHTLGIRHRWFVDVLGMGGSLGLLFEFF